MQSVGAGTNSRCANFPLATSAVLIQASEADLEDSERGLVLKEVEEAVGKLHVGETHILSGAVKYRSEAIGLAGVLMLQLFSGPLKGKSVVLGQFFRGQTGAD